MHKCECHGPSGFGNVTRSGGRLVTPSPAEGLADKPGAQAETAGPSSVAADGGRRLDSGPGAKAAPTERFEGPAVTPPCVPSPRRCSPPGGAGESVCSSLLRLCERPGTPEESRRTGGRAGGQRSVLGPVSSHPDSPCPSFSQRGVGFINAAGSFPTGAGVAVSTATSCPTHTRPRHGHRGKTVRGRTPGSCLGGRATRPGPLVPRFLSVLVSQRRSVTQRPVAGSTCLMAAPPPSGHWPGPLRPGFRHFSCAIEVGGCPKPVPGAVAACPPAGLRRSFSFFPPAVRFALCGPHREHPPPAKVSSEALPSVPVSGGGRVLPLAPCFLSATSTCRGRRDVPTAGTGPCL